MRDKTEFVILLDRSGSMETGRADHQGGLRSFVRDQRQLAGDVRLTLALFDDKDPREIVYDDAPLHDVDESKIELVPRGMTPLLDAVGETIEWVEARQSKFVKPGMTIMMIITDGQENASKEWKKSAVKDLIVRKEKEGWKVLYLGANVDEFREAGSMGVAGAATMGYAATPQGITAMYTTLSSGAACARKAFQEGAPAMAAYNSLTFTEEQRAWSKTGLPEDKEEK